MTELVTVRASAQEREASLRTQWGTDVKNLQAEADKLRKQRDEERKSHNETKGELMDALLTVERAKGYIEATEDVKPPRMIEAPREAHGVFSRQARAEGFDNFSRGSYGEKPKRWFER